ncbi:hypothetical protein FRC03_002288, partial [Tulasnella sp. 419]
AWAIQSCYLNRLIFDIVPEEKVITFTCTTGMMLRPSHLVRPNFANVDDLVDFYRQFFHRGCHGQPCTRYMGAELSVSAPIAMILLNIGIPRC